MEGENERCRYKSPNEKGKACVEQLCSWISQVQKALCVKGSGLYPKAIDNRVGKSVLEKELWGPLEGSVG